MAQLISEAAARGIMPDYTRMLLAAFEAEHQRNAGGVPHLPLATSLPLIDSLSERELEILHLMNQRLSNREMSERLFLALDTVKTTPQATLSCLYGNTVVSLCCSYRTVQ